MTADLVQTSRETIRKGSSSFAAAAALFDAETRADAEMLYAWCRYCDDVIDGQELGHGMAAPGQDAGKVRLEALYAKTRAAIAGEATDDPNFAAFQRVALRRHIPESYATQLIDGFAMDVAGRRYETIEDTLDYCWHVAGVVGVMMAFVMGVAPDDLPTLRRAQDLGLRPSQLTNIARDVIEDAGNGLHLSARRPGSPRPACRRPRSLRRRIAPRCSPSPPACLTLPSPTTPRRAPAFPPFPSARLWRSPPRAASTAKIGPDRSRPRFCGLGHARFRQQRDEGLARAARRLDRADHARRPCAGPAGPVVENLTQPPKLLVGIPRPTAGGERSAERRRRSGGRVVLAAKR